MNDLNYLSSELHATVAPLFGPGTDAFKGAQKAKLATKYHYIASLLGDKPFLLGDHFTVADSYLYIVQSWSGYVGFDMGPFPTIVAHASRVAALPAVIEAHAAMNSAK